MTNIYLAARFSRQSEMREYADDLREMGYRVTSRWLQASKDDYQPHCAVIDELDVKAAHLLISFTGDGNGNPSGGGGGGRHVEFGMARILGLALWIVGPRENVFHHWHSVKVFDTWEDCKHELSTHRSLEHKQTRKG